ncbi:MAG: V-type ATP synthase subunit A [Ruminococcaceae bacterium]|nr:V-type ATP synthase subunit A [Oscillospiraceae bacterium]
MNDGIIKKISGPLVVASGMKNANMFDVVRVSDERLIGEIIEMHEDRASIQVYEETSGLKVGSRVESTGEPLSVELGPGLIGGIFDGIQRPLVEIMNQTGNNLKRGTEIPALDRSRQWVFEPSVSVGEQVYGGDVIGTVQETEVVSHKIMLPVNINGIIKEITGGTCTVEDIVAIVLDEKGQEHGIGIVQRWPVRKPRPYKKKLTPDMPLLTGQRVIDALFPIAKGGVGAIPGPFGSGKTVTQHQVAKWADADIVVYIGCGERGNEMTDVLNEFPELIDPHTGKSLMERTVLIANTSDMPVAAREASIYTGITIAEYFRDMGYSVALMADSTSRWAEALREMSGRLEEMPGEEGYPAYLASRLAQFYERAGRVLSLGKISREGTLSVIGAVSPAGGDISEPVSQATLRIVKVFWGLDSALAYKRHFPAINWLTSYSLYANTLGKWFDENVGREWSGLRRDIMKLLSEEAELLEMVKLVGMDSLSQKDRVKMEIARSVREDFLHQLAFHEVDTFTSPKKQLMMMKLIMEFYDKCLSVLSAEISVDEMAALPVRERIGRFKYIPEESIDESFAQIKAEIHTQLKELAERGE